MSYLGLTASPFSTQRENVYYSACGSDELEVLDERISSDPRLINQFLVRLTSSPNQVQVASNTRPCSCLQLTCSKKVLTWSTCRPDLYITETPWDIIPGQVHMDAKEHIMITVSATNVEHISQVCRINQ